jgi:hypothetical protein
VAARKPNLELQMEIQAMIDLLEDYKARGARTVSISDGAWHYEFNHRFMSVPNYSAPRDVILRPLSNGDGREIDFFETLEDRAKPHWSKE